VRWAVGCGAERRRRLLWRGVPAGTDDVFSDVACTLLPDGTAIAVCYDHNGSLQLWDMATGAPHGRPIGRPGIDHPGPWRAVACTRLLDETLVAATGGGDGVLRVWELPDGRLRSEMPIGLARDTVYALACARLADGTAIAVTASEAGTIRFWDVATGRPRDRTVRCDRSLPRVACTRLADDTPVAVIGDGESLRVWDLAAGEFRGEPVATDFDVYALACLRLGDGTPLAIVGSDRLRDEERSRRYGSAQAWDLATGRRFGPPFTEHGGEINSLAATLLPDGTPVAVSLDRYGAVQAWELATGRAHGPCLPRLGESPALACAELPDGTPVLVTADEDVQAWSLLVEPSANGLTGPIWTVGCVELPDGDEVVATVGQEADGYAVQLWQAETGDLRARLPIGEAVACTRLRDGTPVAVTAGEATPRGSGLRLWDLVSGPSRDVVLAGHSGELHVLDCTTLHDGTPILITDEPIRAWEIDTGQPYGPPLPVELHWRSTLASLSLPDGTLLVILVDRAGSLQVWDPRTGSRHGERLTLAEHVEANAVAATLLRDETPVAVLACGNGKPASLRLWDLAEGRPHGQPLLPSMRFLEDLACTRLPDGTTLAAVSGGEERLAGNGVVEIWDLDQRQVRQVIHTPEPVMGLTFTAGHHLVVRTFLDITVYDLP
jgi:WD40 repeat protein